GNAAPAQAALGLDVPAEGRRLRSLLRAADGGRPHGSGGPLRAGSQERAGPGPESVRRQDPADAARTSQDGPGSQSKAPGQMNPDAWASGRSTSAARLFQLVT